MQHLSSLVRNHKYITGALILLIIIGYVLRDMAGGTNEETRYVLSTAQKGTLIVSVAGTGQVSAENQVELKSEGAGKILQINVKSGQTVTTGDVIAQLDDRDARRAVRDAQNSLASAEIALEKIKQSVDRYEILQAENALAKAKNDVEQLSRPDEASLLQAENALQKAKNDLEKLKLDQQRAAEKLNTMD